MREIVSLPMIIIIIIIIITLDWKYGQWVGIFRAYLG
jgi:hypothetical protein